MSANTGHLEVAHLSIAFEGRRTSPWRRPAAAVQALDDVSLEVAPGEFVAVIGPSGCGKYSYLKYPNESLALIADGPLILCISN